MVVEEAILQPRSMVGMKQLKVRISEIHKEDMDVDVDMDVDEKIKEEEVEAISNVIIATNLVIWRMNAGTRRKRNMKQMLYMKSKSKIKKLYCSYHMMGIVKMNGT
ncbi:hypothetical protein M5689_006569 [Euphorbia peplus]|nr:hypothetical protein M5689_006569 [Euphorbia peplus]